jgi:Fic/DOC family
MQPRPLFPLRDATVVDLVVREYCLRIDAAAARLIQFAVERPLRRWRWADQDAERIIHPLGVHAISRNGRPPFREGTIDAEIRAAMRRSNDIRTQLRCGDVRVICDALLALAVDAGVTAAAIRSGPSAIQPDGQGVQIAFTAYEQILPRLNAIAAFTRDYRVPTSFRAIALQAAILNLHPLHDGNGRVSRALFNCVLWGEHLCPELYIPVYELRRYAPHTFEICLRSAEIQDNWHPITKLYAELIESHERNATDAL